MVGPRASPDPKAEGSSHWDEETEEDPHLVEDPEHPSAPGRARRPNELPPWARFPRVAGAPEGPAFAPVDEAPAAQARRQETQRILDVLDRLGHEVRPRSGSPPTSAPEEPPSVPVPRPRPPAASAARAPPPPVEPTPSEDPGPIDLWESPNLYLEERLRLANAAAAEIGRDVREIEATWARVVGAMSILEEEVHKANEEMAFIRGTGRAPSTAAIELPSTPASARRAPASRSAGARPMPTAPARTLPPTPSVHVPYVAFTAERYNRTIALLKSRRRRLAGWTFLSAGLISIALVGVTALTQETVPPLWLAVLPAVWMIPVPFFALSFRGTQRVLRHNHLEVPGEAP